MCGSDGEKVHVKQAASRPEKTCLVVMTEDAKQSIGFHILNVAVGSSLIINRRLRLPTDVWDYDPVCGVMRGGTVLRLGRWA
jgi:hypothetical protein